MMESGYSLCVRRTTNLTKDVIPKIKAIVGAHQHGCPTRIVLAIGHNGNLKTPVCAFFQANEDWVPTQPAIIPLPEEKKPLSDEEYFKKACEQICFLNPDNPPVVVWFYKKKPQNPPALRYGWRQR